MPVRTGTVSRRLLRMSAVAPSEKFPRLNLFLSDARGPAIVFCETVGFETEPDPFAGVNRRVSLRHPPNEIVDLPANPGLGHTFHVPISSDDILSHKSHGVQNGVHFAW